MTYQTTDMLEALRRHVTESTTRDVIRELATKIDSAISRVREEPEMSDWPRLGPDGRWDVDEIGLTLAKHVRVVAQDSGVRLAVGTDKPAIILRPAGGSIVVSGDW